LGGRVVFHAQTNVGEVRGEYVGRSLLFGFGEAKGDVVFAESGVSFFGVPRGVAHFEGELERGRAKGEKFLEQRLIEFEIGRKLDEDGAEMVAVVEEAGNFEKTLERAFAIAKAFDVSDLLIGFERETETFGDIFGPADEDRFRRHAVETVVDFNGGELFAVEGEHVLVRKFFRVEGALPLFVGVAGSADVKLANARNGAPPENDNIIAGRILHREH